MKKTIKNLMLLSMIFVLLAACTSDPQSTQPAETEGEPTELNVMTHDSFAVSEEVIRAFETENQITVNFLQSGDTGAALNRAILTKGAPQADVFFGVDNTFLSRALEEDIFEPYDSPLLNQIPARFKIDSENRALPVDYGDVCINYDKSYFTENSLAVPQSLDDLLDETYRGLLVVENPATSSPGMAFLIATIAEYGQDGYLNFWEDLKNNGVVVVNDWETAYYTNFSGSSGQGPQPMVVSYSSSPPAEVIFAETELDDAPTASLVGDNMCFRQIEFVGILQGTEKREAAEKFIDFMLSETFQEDLPLQMFVFPVNENAELPEEFSAYAQISENPASLDSALISTERENWIDSWTETVLR